MTTLAVIAGLFITGIVCTIGTIIMMLLMMIMGTSAQHPKGEDHSILYLDLNTEIVERERGVTLMEQVQGLEDNTLALDDLLQAIDLAAGDPKIEGIYINAGNVGGGAASLMSVNESLMRFRKSGKWIAAYGDSYSQADYLLASTADSLWLNPVGEVDIHGVGGSLMYFKNLLDKLGVEMQVIKVGTYKSAVEPFILTTPSEANIEQTRAYLQPVWNDMCAAIGKGRGVKATDVNAWADSIIMTADPQTLPARKVVTSLRYRHDAEEELKALAGIDSDDDLILVSPAEYLNQSYAYKKIKKASDHDYRIAVLYAVGDIVQEGDEGIVGADMTPLIYELADDEDVKALVLRVNSGGGSAYASEQIWKALQYFKSKGKPFYASMGDVAASGGYYISAGADKIFCQPTTITGSIGIFGMIPNVKGLMSNHLGIDYTLIATNPNANIGFMEPMTPSQRAAMQSMINRGYETFVSRCAQGRHLSVDSIKAVAEGRVWVGSQAVKLGLADKLGTLDDCIKALAADNKIKEYSIEKYPDPEGSWWEKLLLEEAQLEERALKRELGPAYPFVKAVRQISTMDPMQARMPMTVIQ